MLQREEIYQRVWGYAMAHGDRSVDVFVRKLRQKLERASPRWRYIHTHFGVGYRFAAESLDPPESAPVPERTAEPAPAELPALAEAVGPDRNRHIRNVLIIIALALVVWLLPGGDTGSSTIYNLLTVILTAGLLFFAFRLYMEHRATIFGLEDRQRGILYGAVALAGFAHHRHVEAVGRGRARRDALVRSDRARGVRHVQRLAHLPGVLRTTPRRPPEGGRRGSRPGRAYLTSRTVSFEARVATLPAASRLMLCARSERRRLLSANLPMPRGSFIASVRRWPGRSV